VELGRVIRPYALLVKRAQRVHMFQSESHAPPIAYAYAKSRHGCARKREVMRVVEGLGSMVEDLVVEG
jgi:hypothetical protein